MYHVNNQKEKSNFVNIRKQASEQIKPQVKGGELLSNINIQQENIAILDANVLNTQLWNMWRKHDRPKRRSDQIHSYS